MKCKQFFLVAFAFLLSTTVLNAEQPSRREARREASYTNGFAMTLKSVGASYNSTGNSPSLGLGYYFGENNCMSACFTVSPYAKQTNLYGVKNFDSWNTSIGAAVFNYIPLARASIGNKFFLEHGLGWKQVFGVSTQNDLDIRSSWAIGYKIGFQYRLSPQVYLGILTGISYSQTTFKNHLDFPTDFAAKTSLVNVFNSPSLYMSYLF